MTFSLLCFAFILFYAVTMHFTVFFTSSPVLLVLSELFWIIMYASSVILAFYLDNCYLLVFSLFFLIFSASEASTAFIILSVLGSNKSLTNLNFIRNTVSSVKSIN